MCYVKPGTVASQSSSPLTHILSHSAADVARGSSEAAQKPWDCNLCAGPQSAVGQSELRGLSRVGLQCPPSRQASELSAP